jgi:hypothetical protein
MSDNISIISTDEENIIWSEKFYLLTERIKNLPEFSLNFQSHPNPFFFSSKKTHRYTNHNGKKNEQSILKIHLGDSQEDLIYQFTIKIEINYFLVEIEKGFFRDKRNVLEKSVVVYPLHIRTEGLTDDYLHGFTYVYSDFKERLRNNNVIWLINEFWKPHFNIDFDLFGFLEKIQKIIEDFYKIEIKEENLLRKKKLFNDKKNVSLELDKDGNGELDFVDGDSFNKIVSNNQKYIADYDKNYLQKFVKISIYLKTKKINTQKIYQSINGTKNDMELNELTSLLKNQIQIYELLVFHSINMVTSLLESDLITFYEIYECFDQLEVFNSNWENDVSNKLTDIESGIKDLMYSINKMENRIVVAIDNLTYSNQESFRNLSISVEKQLSNVNSSIKFNNLMTSIQTYQMYKINKNTKD